MAALAAPASPATLVPVREPTSDQSVQFKVSATDQQITYNSQVQTIGAELKVNYQSEREAIAFAAYGELLAQYADWKPIGSHKHPQLTSEPE